MKPISQALPDSAPANCMSPIRRFSDLTPSLQGLIRGLQAIGFGQILNLQVKDSDPVLNPAPIALVDVKLDADGMARTELALEDFTLKDEIRRLVAFLGEVQNGTIARIEVRDGLPKRIIFERRMKEAR